MKYFFNSPIRPFHGAVYRYFHSYRQTNTITTAKYKIIIFILLGLCTTVDANIIVVVDDWQRTISPENPVWCIITLAPHLTELIYSMGSGTNIYADLEPQVVRLGREALLLSKPDYIFHSFEADIDKGTIANLFGDEIPTHHIESDLIQRPSLRIVEGVEKICRIYSP